LLKRKLLILILTTVVPSTCCSPQDIQRFYNTVIEELPSNVNDLI
jgi:hypothetical protein